MSRFLLNPTFPPRRLFEQTASTQVSSSLPDERTRLKFTLRYRVAFTRISRDSVKLCANYVQCTRDFLYTKVFLTQRATDASGHPLITSLFDWSTRARKHEDETAKRYLREERQRINANQMTEENRT